MHELGEWATRQHSKFKQADVDPKRPKLTADSGMTHVEARILELVAKLHPSPSLRSTGSAKTTVTSSTR